MKRLLLVLIISLIPFSFNSCLGPEEYLYKYVINDVNHTVIEFVYEEDSSYRLNHFFDYFIDSSNCYIIDTNGYFGLNIQFIPTIIETHIVARSVGMNIGNAAYAFSKTTHTYEIMVKLDSISIFTLNNFDSLHPANTSIKELFVLGGFNPDKLVDDIPGMLNSDRYLTQIPPYSNLRLIEEPSTDTILRFKLDFYFENGTVISEETTPVCMMNRK